MFEFKTKPKQINAEAVKNHWVHGPKGETCKTCNNLVYRTRSKIITPSCLMLPEKNSVKTLHETDENYDACSKWIKRNT